MACFLRFFKYPIKEIFTHLLHIHTYADCKNTDSGQGADRYRLQCKAKGLDDAGKSVSVESKIYRRNFRTTGIYRLYRQFQDLYQIPEIQKADGKSERESADI